MNDKVALSNFQGRHLVLKSQPELPDKYNHRILPYHNGLDGGWLTNAPRIYGRENCMCCAWSFWTSRDSLAARQRYHGLRPHQVVEVIQEKGVIGRPMYFDDGVFRVETVRFPAWSHRSQIHYGQDRCKFTHSSVIKTSC